MTDIEPGEKSSSGNSLLDNSDLVRVFEWQQTLKKERTEEEEKVLNSVGQLIPEQFKDAFSKLMNETNQWRLMAIRLKWMITAVPDESGQSKQVDKILNQSNLALSYVAWIFYGPRMMLNIASLINIVYESRDKSYEEQKKILHEAWKNRWSELVNDTTWFGVGITACFLVTSVVATYLIVGGYTIDVLNNLVKTHYNIKTLEADLKKLNIEKNTLQKLNKVAPNKTYEDEIDNVTQEIENKKEELKFEKKQSKVQKAFLLAVLAAAICTIPPVAVAIGIPLLAAGIALFSSIAYVYVQKYYLKPPTSLTDDSRLSTEKSEAEEDAEEDVEKEETEQLEEPKPLEEPELPEESDPQPSNGP